MNVFMISHWLARQGIINCSLYACVSYFVFNVNHYSKNTSCILFIFNLWLYLNPREGIHKAD